MARGGLRAGLRQLARVLNAGWGLDLRSLALFRVVVAIVILADLWARAAFLEAHYTDHGVLPRDVLLDKFMGQWLSSLHVFNGTAFWMGAIFVLHGVFALLLLVGWRTRLMTLLCWLLAISLQARMPMVLQAGDVLLRLLLFWSLFLPLGARWSIDAGLRDRDTPRPKRVLSMGTVAIMAQVCFVYWFGCVLKSGPEWRTDGTAVYFALSLDHFATPAAALMLEHPDLMKALTFLTFWLEALGPVLALLPLWPTRLLGVLLMIGMHVGFRVGLEIGMFVYISSACWVFWIPSGFWDRLSGWILSRRPAEMRIAIAPGASHTHTKLLRLLRELLILPRAELVEAREEDLDALADARWVVLRPDGKVHRRSAALKSMFRASPLLFPLDFLAPALYFVFSGRIAGWLADRMLQRRLRWRSTIIAQLIAATLIGYVFLWNLTGLKPPSYEMPPKYKRVAWTLRLDQKWSMFAPFPMKSDGWFVLPGTLRNGETVDIWTLEPVTFDKPELGSTWYPGQRWRKYLMNLWQARYKAHRLHFGRYMCRVWNRTHSEGETLETFHLMYMKELTTLEGHEPHRCVSLWRHWCTERGKDVPTPEYETTCKSIRGEPASTTRSP